eukprot:COSAG02_NODE_2704_length_8197_cov_2.646085_6_plen_64_part_00
MGVKNSWDSYEFHRVTPWSRLARASEARVARAHSVRAPPPAEGAREGLAAAALDVLFIVHVAS